MWKACFMVRLGDDIATDLEIDCPRCGATVVQRFYGPCASCRNELHERFVGAARDDVAPTQYEPKMNVTPNAVASKD